MPGRIGHARRAATLVTCLALAAAGCSSSSGELDPAVRDQRAAEAARAWARTAMELARDEGLSPPAVARLAGYLGLAIHTAVAPAHAGRGRLVTTVPGMPDPGPRPSDVDSWVALPVAASRVLKQHLAGRHRVIDQLAGQQGEQAGAGVATGALSASRAWGDAVADALLRRADSDGYTDIDGKPYTPVDGVAPWVPTPPGFHSPLQPHWGTIALFLGAEHCALAPPPPYDTRPAHGLRAEAEAVHRIALGLTPEQRSTADYWNDPPLATVTPPGHWLLIAADVTRDRSVDLGGTARVLALVGMALADAGISAWHWKYHYGLVRPITLIRRFADPEWTPYITTPPFPEYPSGHSTFSAAAATVLAGALGEHGFVDRVNLDVVGKERRYDTFAAAADEAGMSRVYGGIHFPVGNESGKQLGRCVGDRALKLAATVH